MSIFWIFLLILVFVLLEGFFSGTEMALISVNRIKMEQLAQSKVKKAVLLRKILSSPDRLLSTTLVGTNLCVVMSSALFTVLIVEAVGEQYSWLTTVVMTPVVLIFAEAVPKIVFRYYADKLAFRLAWFLRGFELIFWPVVIIVKFIARIILFPLRIQQPKKSSLYVTREELKFLIKEGKKNDVIKPNERAIIHRIFDFGSKKVKEIMLPIRDALSIDISEGIAHLKELSGKSGFSRVLVWEKDKKNIVGFVNVFDVLYEENRYKSISECVRPVLYVSCETPIDKVFYSLQLKRRQIAVLLDENNKHAGMVTVKDLLDEIVERA
ncbi:MAG: hemolysin family protein [Candidatus Omnitrophota bacterium]